MIVTTPETPETLGMFNARLFSRMQRGSYFINISRGGCILEHTASPVLHVE